MPDDSLLGQLAEEFTAHVRKGQLPSLDDYATRHPQLAERIRALFPTLLLLEGLANGSPTDTAPRAAERLAPGAVLGPYRIEREIGRGGMGVVYEAVHQVLDRRVALKVLRAEGLEGGALERFLREAQTAAGLHHTNIVPVFDLGQVGGVPYYAMQLIAGRGLDHVLREEADPSTVMLPSATDNSAKRPPAPTHQRVQWQQVAEWGAQAADALAYAHRRGVIHRDIKPSNLLLDGQGIVWITDFGLARRVQDVALTRSGALLGTPRYMSPEQAQAARQPVDRRTDIYSLGATLYELATGRPAFDGPTPLEVVLAIVERVPVPPRRLEPCLPRDLETIILKAMAKRPDDRYQDAADLAEDLRRLLRQEPIRARRIGPLGRTMRWCRRNPRLAAVSMAIAMLIAILVSSHIVSLHYANAMIAEEKQTAEQHRDAALASEKTARDALEVSKDHLARSLYEQARAVRHTTEAGRRGKALELLQAANALRLRQRESAAADGALPSVAELRSEALAALIQRDVRLVRELPVLHDTVPTVTRDGRRALMYWAKPRTKKRGVYIVDLADGKEVSRFADDAVGDCNGNVALNDDATLIAYGTHDPAAAVQLVETATGDVTRDLAWPTQAPKEFKDHLTVPLFVPGRSLLAGYRSTEKQTCVVVWELDQEDDKGRVVATFACHLPPSSGYHPAIAFNHTGRQLIMREGDRTLVVVDVDQPATTRKFALPLQTGPQLVRSPRGRLVAVAGIRPDMLQSSLILWDVQHGAERARCEGDFAPEGWFPMAFAPDGNFVAACCVDGSIRVFTTADGKEWLRFGTQFAETDALLAWSADGRLIWAGDAGLRVWDILHENGIVSALPVTPRLLGYDLSRDGRWLATLSGPPRNALILVDRATGKQVREWQVPGPSPPAQPFVSFRPDSKVLTLLGEHQVLAVDVETGKEVLRRESRRESPQGEDGAWYDLALPPDGRVLTTMIRGEAVVVWDLTNQREVRRFTDLPARVKMLKDNPRMRWLSNDGRWLLLQPPDEPSMLPLVLWDVATGREVLRLVPPAGAPPTTNPGATMSVDGRRLAVWRFPARTDADARLPDSSVQVIDVSSARVLLEVRDNALTGQGDFSLDGRYLTVRYDDSSAGVWDIDKQTELFRWKPITGRVSDWFGVTDQGGPVVTGALWTEMLLLDVPRLRRELAALKLDW